MDRRKWAVKLDDDVIVNFTNTTFPMSTFTVIVFLTASSASPGLKWPFARDTGWSESGKNQKS